MIKENIADVRKNIAEACKRAGRNPDEITLIAVSKTKPVEMLREAMDEGIMEFGENKVQEILEKSSVLPDGLHWHMIGHLQRNKVRQVLPHACLIHSVDSIRLAEQIQEDAARLDITVPVLLEVNVAREESKHGFLMEEVLEAVRKLREFSNIRINGLMTIAPFVENSQDNRKFFKELYDLSVDIKCKNIDNVSMDVLSMGMTGDYEVAIEEGATMIRVGTGIFGTRERLESRR